MDSYQKKLNEMKAAREQAQARSTTARTPAAVGVKSTSSPSVNTLANKATTPTVNSNTINRTPTTTSTFSANTFNKTPTPTTPTPSPIITPTPTPTPTLTPTTPTGVVPKSTSFRGTSPAALGLGQLPKPPGAAGNSPGGGSGSFRGRTTAPLSGNNNNNNNNNSDGSDFKSLYESEVKQRMLIEEELKALKASSSSETNAVRELNLLKTEVKVNNMKLDSEIRKRETLERELAASKEEIKTLKEKQSNQPSPSTSATAAKTPVTRVGQVTTGSGPTRADSGPQKGNVVRASRRQTRVGGGPAAQSPNIVQMITRVLDEMQKLEGNIKKAEAGRMRAEGELLEVAMYKQASDDALESLINDVKVIHTAILENNNLLSAYMNHCAPDVRESLGNFVGKFAKLADDLVLKSDNAKIPVKTEEVNKRVTIMATKLNIPPPPPMAPTIPNNTPRPPPPPGSGPTRAPGSVRGDRNSTARASTLLDQIRKGKNLNKIDLETIQRDRDNQVSGNRKSMALLASLQETLRAALNARQDDMNLYDEEDEEEWY